jgi:hypothetical protein
MEPESERKIHSKIMELDTLIEECWGKYFVETLGSLLAVDDVTDHRISYGVFLVQVYHWATYTGRSLALAGANSFQDTRIAKHFLKHAYEETGHHTIAKRDILALGLSDRALSDELPPLPATRQLVAFVHWLATMENPIHLLGYDYWTESSYRFFQKQASVLTAALGLRTDQMSFLESHCELDKKHKSDIQRLLVATEITPGDWRELKRNIEITISMMIRIIDESISESERVRSGEPTPYAEFADLRGQWP